MAVYRLSFKPSRRLVILILVAVVLGGLAALLAAAPVWTALGGESKALILTISIIAAALGFTAKQVAEAVSALFREGLAPLDRVSVFIEDIQFELPTIPEALLDHPISQGELSGIQTRFVALKESLTLTETEADRINNIARGVRVLSEVESGVPYTLENVFSTFISYPLFNVQRWLLRWPQTLQHWAESLSRHRTDDESKLLGRFVTTELERMSTNDASDIFQQLIWLIIDKEVQIPEIQKHKTQEGEDIEVEFINPYTLTSPSGESPDFWILIRNKFYWLAKQTTWIQSYLELFVQLFKHAQIDQLITLFEDAAPIIERESRRMYEYIVAWNSILKDRQSSFFILTTTLSNLGRFDSFVGSQGQVGIGPSGSPPSIKFIVEEYEESGVKSRITPYIAVEKRQAKSVKFIARLGREQRESVRSAFESGLVYLRLGLLVSIGHSENQVLSPSTPFSVEARKQYEQKIKNIKMLI